MNTAASASPSSAFGYRLDRRCPREAVEAHDGALDQGEEQLMPDQPPRGRIVGVAPSRRIWRIRHRPGWHARPALDHGPAGDLEQDREAAEKLAPLPVVQQGHAHAQAVLVGGQVGEHQSGRKALGRVAAGPSDPEVAIMLFLLGLGLPAQRPSGRPAAAGSPSPGLAGVRSAVPGVPPASPERRTRRARQRGRKRGRRGLARRRRGRIAAMEAPRDRATTVAWHQRT